MYICIVYLQYMYIVVAVAPLILCMYVCMCRRERRESSWVGYCPLRTELNSTRPTDSLSFYPACLNFQLPTPPTAHFPSKLYINCLFSFFFVFEDLSHLTPRTISLFLLVVGNIAIYERRRGKKRHMNNNCG